MSKFFLPKRTAFRYLTREPQPLPKTDPVQVIGDRSGRVTASFWEFGIAMYAALEFVMRVWRDCVGALGWRDLAPGDGLVLSTMGCRLAVTLQLRRRNTVRKCCLAPQKTLLIPETP
jgi:hypothetical protein